MTLNEFKTIIDKVKKDNSRDDTRSLFVDVVFNTFNKFNIDSNKIADILCFIGSALDRDLDEIPDQWKENLDEETLNKLYKSMYDNPSFPYIGVKWGNGIENMLEDKKNDSRRS